MTQEEFEKLRARLEDQLRQDIEMLYEAHRVKLRAFETIRQARAELGGSERLPVGAERRPASALHQAMSPPVSAPPRRATRSEDGSVFDRIVETLGALPEEFDKYDLVRALGQEEPKKATLARALQALCEENVFAMTQKGVGRFPARYRKLPRAAGLTPRVAAETETESEESRRDSGGDAGNAAEPA